MVDCSQFLAGYSDYRDGLLEGAALEEYEDHRVACASCSRYDRVVGRGAQILRELPPIEPSYDFLPRLQHRIFHLEEDAKRSQRRAWGASVAVALGIVVMLGAAARLPIFQPQQRPVIQLPPVAAHEPHPTAPVPVLFQTGPLLTSATQQAVPAPPRNTLFFQYSPLGASNARFTRTVSSP